MPARGVTADELFAMGSDSGFELIRGELVEMPFAGFQASSLTAGMMTDIGIHVHMHGLGHVTGPDGGYILARDPDTVLAPDIAFVGIDRLPAHEKVYGFFDGAPDLVVEVVTEEKLYSPVMERICLYLQTGVSIVWVVDIAGQSVAAYTPTDRVREIKLGGVLDGGNVIPNLRISVADVFGLPIATAKPITAEDLYAMEDHGGRHELIDGVLHEKPLGGGQHGQVVAGIGSRIWMHAQEHQLGTGYAPGTGFVISRNPDSVLAPDVSFVRAGRLPAGCDRQKFVEAAPDLVVEVISPSDQPGDVTSKVQRYLNAGVQLVWVVYPEERMVAVYNADRTWATVQGDEAHLDGGDVLPGLTLPLADVFPPLD